jgi:hypothetical protein
MFRKLSVLFVFVLLVMGCLNGVSAKVADYNHNFTLGEKFEINEVNMRDYGPNNWRQVFDTYRGTGLFTVIFQGNHGWFNQHNLFVEFVATSIGDKIIDFNGCKFHLIVNS